MNVFGNTHGTVVDETDEREPGDRLSTTRLGEMIDRVSLRPVRLTLPAAVLSRDWAPGRTCVSSSPPPAA